MSDLVAFIEARLAEDEAAARAATPGPWTDFGRQPYGVEQLGYDDGHMIAEIHQCGAHEGREAGDAEHIARHDPARVLREVEAKRRLLAHIIAIEPARFGHQGWNGTKPTTYVRRRGPDVRPSLLAHMAALWSDHSDFKAEWNVIPTE